MEKIELAPSRRQGQAATANMHESTLYAVQQLARESGAPASSELAKAYRKLAAELEGGKVAGLVSQFGLQLAAHGHAQAPSLLRKARHGASKERSRVPIEGWGNEHYGDLLSLITKHTDRVASVAWQGLPVLPSWSPDIIEFAKAAGGFALLARKLPDHAAELHELLQECILVPGDEIPWTHRQWARGFSPTWAAGVWMLPSTEAYVSLDLALELVRAGAILLVRARSAQVALVVEGHDASINLASGDWPTSCADMALEEGFAAARMLGCLDALGLTKGAVQKALATRLRRCVAAVEQNAVLTPDGTDLVNRIKSCLGRHRLEVVS